MILNAFILFLCCTVKSTAAESCKAIALSGGGAKGAYEAGVLWGLYHTDPDKSNYAYDVVTGVSAGAINTACMAMFKPGDELNLITYMSNKW